MKALKIYLFCFYLLQTQQNSIKRIPPLPGELVSHLIFLPNVWVFPDLRGQEDNFSV